MQRLLFIAFLSLSFSVSFSQTKRALIIAIGNYPSNSGWDFINSANDVPMIQSALLKQNFLPENITILKDAQATKKGIENAFEALLHSSNSGDIVVIHVSSHGEQIEDNDGDEADGLDEAIVPYDAIYSEDKSKFHTISAGYLRDDEFGEILTNLRNKLGKNGDILVTMDACHSGSGTRGSRAKIRGSKAPMVSDSFDTNKMGLRDKDGVFRDNNKTKLNADAASFVLISGALAQEMNCECYDDQKTAMGSLSYAFGKALSTLDGKVTYATLFTRINDILQQKVSEKPEPNCKQNPVVEGEGLDREIFGGKYQQQVPYYSINKLKSNSTAVEINGGTVSGITVGSVVSFYPDDVLDPAGIKPIQKGKVTAAQNFSSTVKLDKPNPALLKNIVKAFVTETSYGTTKIKICLDSLNIANKTKIATALKGFQAAEINPKGELYLSKETSGFALRYPNTKEVFTQTNSEDPVAIKEALQRYARYKYLRGLNFNESGLAAKVELVFVDENGNIDSNKIRQHTKLGRLELKEDDVVHLKITNTGTKNFYINIVDMQPDGIINPILPNKAVKVTPDDCIVNVGAELLFPNGITIGPPYGSEIFKVFLFSSRLDLEKTLTTQSDAGAGSRGGVLNEMEKMFKGSEVSGVGARGNPTNINTSNGTIFNINFSIIPK